MAQVAQSKRIAELEEEIETLKKRIDALENRPEPHDPFRPIGPRPGESPWKPGKPPRENPDPVWPPSIRRLGDSPHRDDTFRDPLS